MLTTHHKVKMCPTDLSQPPGPTRGDLFANETYQPALGLRATAVIEGLAGLDDGCGLRFEPDVDELLRELYEAIEPELYRYPAIDPPVFRRKAEAALG
jgi:hypothetical protein